MDEDQGQKETQTRVAKRKANEESVGEAVKAMKLDEMTAYVNEVSAAMGSLHEAEPLATSDPTKDPKKVFAGRKREFGHLLYFDTYDNVHKSEFPPDAKRVDMRWEERPKGDECRSRLVLRDYNKGHLDEMFAATPTSVGLQILLILSSALGLDAMVGDLNCGFMHAEPSEPLYAKPPSDAHLYDENITADAWWRVKKAINGGRQALQDFNEWFGKNLEKLGFVRLRVDSQMFMNPTTGVFFHVHVDDPWAVGPKAVPVAPRISGSAAMRTSGLAI